MLGSPLPGELSYFLSYRTANHEGVHEVLIGVQPITSVLKIEFFRVPASGYSIWQIHEYVIGSVLS